MTDCLFCRIVDRSIDADIVYEDDALVAFRDISPQAPTHILIIPRQHIATTNDLRSEHQELMGQLMLSVPKIACDQGVEEDGYRLVMNCQEGAGQSVFHIHLHLLAGRSLSWPPG